MLDLYFTDVSCYCGSNNRGPVEHQLIRQNKTSKKQRARKPGKQNKLIKRKRTTGATDTEIDSDVTYLC